MKYRITPVTDYQQNSTLIWCEQTNEAVITDPGGDIDQLLDNISEENLSLKEIWLTHGHIDHIGFTAELAERTGVPIIGPHRADQFLLDSLDQYAEWTNLPHAGSFTPQRWLDDGDQVTVGQINFDVVHCPGHTPGHVVFVNPAEKLAIVGDVLFAGSIGRTDFPQGKHSDLIDSIKRKLLPLGDEIEFIPGHGPNSTFGRERQTNPHLI